MTDDGKLKMFRKVWDEIANAPGARFGETIIHNDGSVTEDRWQFHEPEPRPAN